MRTNSIPNQALLCPISGVLMKNPVMAVDGYTYEREHIEKWFTEKGEQAMSPVTGEGLLHCELLPNRALKRVIDAYRVEQSDLEQNLSDVASRAQQTEILRTERAGLILTRGRVRQLAHRAVSSSRLMEQSKEIANRRALLKQSYQEQKINELAVYQRAIQKVETAFQAQLNYIKVKIQAANEREDDEAVRNLTFQRQELRKKYEASKAPYESQYKDRLQKIKTEYHNQDGKWVTAERQVEAAKGDKVWRLQDFARRLERLDKAIDAKTQVVRESCEWLDIYLEQRAAFFVPRAVTTTTPVKPAVVEPVRPPIDPELVQAFLTAVYRGELETVDGLLKTTPTLVYSEGDLTDLSKRSFSRITGFQYAVWALDWLVWEVILQYLPKDEAAAQLRAYTARQDLIAAHGLQYSFDNLLKEYDVFIQNYSRWSWDQLNKQWVKKIAPEQAKMPSWLIYAFTEPGDNVAWVKMDIDQGYLRVLSNEFKEFHRIIDGGNGFQRWRSSLAVAIDTCFLPSGLFYDRNLARSDGGMGFFVGPRHDVSVMKSYNKKSNIQYHDLVNQLNSKPTIESHPTTPSRLRAWRANALR